MVVFFFVGEKMKVVNKNFVVRIYPSKVDKNDKGEKIVSIDKIESHIGGYRFIFNKELEYINEFRRLLIQNGYEDKVIVNDSSCNVLLKMLRQDNLFFGKKWNLAVVNNHKETSYKPLKIFTILT